MFTAYIAGLCRDILFQWITLFALHCQACESTEKRLMELGLAIDYGTSKIRAALIDRGCGEILAETSCDNRLSAYGPDILSRIAVCGESEKRRSEVFDTAAASLNDILQLLQKKSRFDLRDNQITVIAANTTHMYLLLREDPGCIMTPPYNLPFHAPLPLEGRALGLPLLGKIYFVPCKANYLGGDMLCGLLDVGIAHSDLGTVLFDLGVNGEFIIVGRDALYAASCAAGCALGSGVFTGSEMNEITAELYRNGIINHRGRLQMGTDPGIREEESPTTHRVMLTYEWGGRLVRQSDLASFMQGKASIATMIEYITEASGLSSEDIKNFTLTGTMGCRLDTQAAETIGLLPALSYQKRKNAVINGVRKLALDETNWSEVYEIYDKIRYVQLWEVADYLEIMLPHLWMP